MGHPNVHYPDIWCAPPVLSCNPFFLRSHYKMQHLAGNTSLLVKNHIGVLGTTPFDCDPQIMHLWKRPWCSSGRRGKNFPGRSAAGPHNQNTGWRQSTPAGPRNSKYFSNRRYFTSTPPSNVDSYVFISQPTHLLIYTRIICILGDPWLRRLCRTLCHRLEGTSIMKN